MLFEKNDNVNINALVLEVLACLMFLMSKARLYYRDSRAHKNSAHNEAINAHVVSMSHDMFLCLYRADTNVDQTITCTQEQQGQEEFYVDVSSSDDEQVESLVCAAKKEGLYYHRCCIIRKGHWITGA